MISPICTRGVRVFGYRLCPFSRRPITAGLANPDDLVDEEIRRLRREVARLSDLLREHGIEPTGPPGQKSA